MAESIKFYVDEHVAKAVVRGLRKRGIDVLTPQDAGTLGAADEDHLLLASEQERVIFTQDDDFLRMAASGREHTGIVFAPQQLDIGDVVHGLMLVYQVLTPDEMKNHIEFL